MVGNVNNCIITSGAVIMNQQNQILLKKDPVRDWELPGGMVEPREKVEQAVVREVKEETGIDIEIIRFCGVSQEINKNICNFWWLGKVVGGALETSVESLEVGFFDLEEALDRIKDNNFKEELLQVLNQSNYPFFITFE
ncbi:NUDIX hydrolase [Natronobacillus azotifigens]